MRKQQKKCDQQESSSVTHILPDISQSKIGVAINTEHMGCPKISRAVKGESAF
jgi:hypothetical protein